MSSRWRARREWKRVVKLHARLTSRESDVVAAAAGADVSADALDPDALHGFAVQRIAAERVGWQRGDPTSIPVLFGTHFDRPEGRCRILVGHDPLVRLVWAGRRAADDPSLVALLVSLELVTTGPFSKQYSIESAYWTMGPERDGWKIERVEGAAEGRHFLTDPLLDKGPDQELHDEAAISTAVEDAAPKQLPVGQLTDADAPTRSQLLDLSVVDGRYAPDAIAACVSEIARLWESATSAQDRKLLEPWCTAEAATQLLHPTPHGWRRVLNLETRGVQIDALHTESDPPTISVTLQLHGQRWLATDHGTRLSGSRIRHRDFTEHWTLRLDPSTSCPWRLTDVQDAGRP
jgi:hypothetical protein